MARGAAAAALATVAAADAELETRLANGEYYERAFAGRAGIGVPRAPEGGRPGYLRFALLREGGVSGLSEAVAARDLGAGPPYPLPLPELPVLKPRLARDLRTAWRGAHEIVRNLLTLPTHSAVTAEDRAALVNLIATGPIPNG
jgi:dTDP-4-amino-4,6-dideoxygalactose transaminase